MEGKEPRKGNENGQGVETEESETKRDRVRRLLINPLLRAGMRKQTRMSAEDYAEMLVRLADKLAYLPDEHLKGLVQVATRCAKGKERNQWPDEVSLIAWGYGLQSPPPRECDYVASLMRSEAGRRARAMGYHVELFMIAKKLGPPPSKYDLRRLDREAQENRREMGRVTAQIERGTATEERRQWLDWYLRHEEACLAIMGGDARAEGKAA